MKRRKLREQERVKYKEMKELIELRQEIEQEKETEESKRFEIERKLKQIEDKKKHRQTYQDIMYSQNSLKDAIKEAKSMANLLGQSKMKMIKLKMELEEKTLPKFLPGQLLS